MYRNGTVMLPAEKRVWVVECKLDTYVEWYNQLHVDVKDWTWSGSALIAGWLVLKRTLVSRRRQRTVVDKGAVFATTML